MGDADDSYDFANLYPFLEKLREGYDLVMGNRFMGGIKAGAMPPLHRYLGNPALSFIGRLFFKNPCGDFHCGLRGFSKKAFEQMDLRTTGMEFASEMIVKAVIKNIRIVEVPTILSPDGRSRPSHLRSWRDGWRHLRFLLLYSPNWLFLYPGMALFLIGLAIGLWILPEPRIFRGSVIDVHTLLYAAAMALVGFQSINFAIFSKIYGTLSGLLPPDPKLEKAFQFLTLEVGLLLGGILIFFGAAGSMYAFWSWSALSFGPLNYQKSLRLVIPAVLFLMLGCQILLMSFFLSFLGLRRRGR